MKKGRSKMLLAVLSCACLLSGTVACAEEVQTPPMEQPSEMGAVVPTEADAAVFVQAVLDLVVKQDPTAAASLGYITEEEWSQEFSAHIAELCSAYSEMSVSQEAMEKLIATSMNMLAQTRYMAGATRRLEDGCSFEVTVTYEQMHVFDKFWDKYAVVLAAWESSLQTADAISYDDIFSQAFVLVAGILDQCCAEATYGEPTTVTFTVVWQDGRFVMDTEAVTAFSKLLYDPEALYATPQAQS